MKLYRPSNGTEGDGFISRWCSTCAKYRGGQCAILCHTMIYDVNKPGYPKEWTYNQEYRPICTAWTDKSVYERRVRSVRQNPKQLSLFGGV